MTIVNSHMAKSINHMANRRPLYALGSWCIVAGFAHASTMKQPAVKVLIVETYPVVRLGMRTMIRTPGIQVVGEARTFAEALALLKKLAVDLVVAHVQPSELNALSIVLNLKEKHPKVSVIVITRSEEPDHLLQAVLCGCSGYVDEGVERAELVETIRAVSSGKCVLPRTLLRGLLEKCPREPVAPGDKVPPLTSLERNVLTLIMEGATNRQIAEKLGYSVATVKVCVQKIIEKLGVSDRTQAAVKAVRLRIIP